MILWRLVPWRAQAPPTEPGGALWFPRELQGLGRHDNPDRYGCLYASEAAVSAVAEALAPFRTTGALSPQMLVRAGLPLALAQLDLDDRGRLVDLDDPRVLARIGVRPSRVATRTRTLTQVYAAHLFDGPPEMVGLRWWSTLEASLINLTLFDRAAPHLGLVDTEQLTVEHAAVVEAAELLGLAVGTDTPRPRTSGSSARAGHRALPSMRRRLPHGPQTDREAVARHQRARLLDAMVEAVSRQGYKGATVAHVIALAGISRRTFYAHFANREDCFLATYDMAVARARKQAVDAWRQASGWENRMRRSYEAFVEDSTKNSKSMRLVLIEGLGLGSKSRERLMRSAVTFERIVADGFKAAPDGVQLPPLGSRAIVGGGRYVVFDRLFTGRERELPSLSAELLAWSSAYHSRAARIGARRAPPLRTPVQPARFLENEDERTRLLGATVHLVLDEGYSELTDSQIAAFAQVPTGAFHEQFASKQECVLAVTDAFVDETLETIASAAIDGSNWSQATYLAVKAGIEHLRSHPGLTQIAFADVFEVGAAVAKSISRSVNKLSSLLAATAPEPLYAPAIVHDAVAGAMWALVLSYAPRRRLNHLPALGDQMAFIALAPYVGPKAAAQTITDAT